ncbi:MAG: sulfite exporter TauE/SafE family protein [Microthrixaceae bacterium]
MSSSTPEPRASAAGAIELSTSTWIRVALVGLVAGAASGLFGVGGGTIIVPGLVLVAGFSQKLATGTSLAAVVPISAAALVGYARGDSVDVQRGLWICLGAVVGTLIGTRLLRRTSDGWLQLGFALLLVATSLRMLWDSGEGLGAGPVTAGTAVALVALGLVTGVLSGLFGVGGGIVIVPALTLVGNVSVAVAKGTSLLAIIPPAVVATASNRSVGLAALGPAAVLGASGIVSAVVVASLAVDLEPGVATAAFAAFLLLIAVRMAVTAWRTST